MSDSTFLDQGPGEIDSIENGVKAQATDGDGDVATDGEGEGGLEEAKDWPRLRKLLDVDEKSRLFLDMFEAAYSVRRCSDALLNVQDFLGRFLVKEFDHEVFQKLLGEEIDSIDADLTAASTLALRMVMTIAKIYGLRPGDLQEINSACGKAVRSLPACYHLQRLLPGPLNDARALRAYQDMDEEMQSLNPWHSPEGQALFESRHGVSWEDMQALTSNDGSSLSSFHAAFVVKDVVKMPALSIVHLSSLWGRQIPKGDVVLWEVDGGLGQLLQEGFVLEGHWSLYKECEFCFMCELESIYPDWAAPKSESAESP